MGFTFIIVVVLYYVVDMLDESFILFSLSCYYYYRYIIEVTTRLNIIKLNIQRFNKNKHFFYLKLNKIITLIDQNGDTNDGNYSKIFCHFFCKVFERIFQSIDEYFYVTIVSSDSKI